VSNLKNRDAKTDKAQLFGLTDNHLIYEISFGATIHPHMQFSLQQLKDRAAKSGFDLRIASAFRSFERQLLIWNQKALGQRTVLNALGEPIDIHALSDTEKVFAILQWSALPGASRHHWGTDIDVYDASKIDSNYRVQLTEAETQGDGPFAEFHQWLDVELQKPDAVFFRPYIKGVGGISPEPWHLSFAPIAHPLAKALTIETLHEQLVVADIELKSSILQHLNEIFDKTVKPYQLASA
jgi:LAS superfamily LD-carboxypeptidase LdcB